MAKTNWNRTLGEVLKQKTQPKVMVSEKTRKMLRMYYLVDIKSIKELKIKEYVIENINNFLTTYYDRYTGIYIHTKKFLDKTITI